MAGLRRAISALLAPFALLLLALAASAQTGGTTVPIYMFWSEGCPHCAHARRFLEPEIAADSHLELHLFEVSQNAESRALFLATLEHFQVERAAVPTIVAGGEIFVGFDGPDGVGAEVLTAARGCRLHRCADPVGLLLAQASAPAAPPETAPPAARTAAPPRAIALPLIGEIETATLSLPLLTVLLGAVDGFNPCAMWVLVFLIGLLQGLRERRRRWILGATFLMVSGAVYYAFMAAWLNAFLLIGALVWVRLAIGVFALGAGGYYLREAAVNAEGVCQVEDLEGRQRTMARLRRAVGAHGLWLSMLGVAAIAVAVNLIELLCSAGLPAIFTQVLALSDLPAWAYYAYLGLYLLMFMLDDVIVFATAMLALEAAGAAAASYARWSHGIGGVALVAIGALLLLRPDWLSLG